MDGISTEEENERVNHNVSASYSNIGYFFVVVKTILLHPTYFPNILQMAAIAQAENVVFEIHDNYQKQTYRNRTYIATSTGKLLLNIPIKHSKDGTKLKYSEVVTEPSFPWQSQHWKSLATAYRTSPFFEFYEDDLKPLFTQKASELMAHNFEILNLLCELIGIDVTYSKSAEYFREPTQKDLRNLANVKREKEHTWTPYTQVFGSNHGFLPNLSILDLLFNEGPNTLDYLESHVLDI